MQQDLIVDAERVELAFDLAGERLRREELEELVASLRVQHFADIGRLEAQMHRMLSEYISETAQLQSRLKELEVGAYIHAPASIPLEKFDTERSGDERATFDYSSFLQRSVSQPSTVVELSDSRSLGRPPVAAKAGRGQPLVLAPVHLGSLTPSPHAAGGPPPAVRALVSVFEKRSQTPSAMTLFRSRDCCAAEGGQRHATPRSLDPPTRTVLDFRSRPPCGNVESEVADGNQAQRAQSSSGRLVQDRIRAFSHGQGG